MFQVVAVFPYARTVNQQARKVVVYVFAVYNFYDDLWPLV